MSEADFSLIRWAVLSAPKNRAVEAEQAVTRLEEQLEAVRQERDAIGASLGEPCAECGHIDWRSDGYADDLKAANRCTCTRDGEGFTEMRGCPKHDPPVLDPEWKA